MPERLAITTLTCNDRDTLFGTVSSLLKQTSLDLSADLSPKWWILLQGCSEPFFNKVVAFLQGYSTVTISQLPPSRDAVKPDRGVERKEPAERKGSSSHAKNVSHVHFHLLVSEANLGLSKGNNILCEHVREVQYVLNVEDDWTLLPESVTQCPRSWLQDCVTFLDRESQVSTLFLRKYASAREKWQYGWSRVLCYRTHQFANNFNWSAKMKADGGSAVKYLDDGRLRFQEIPFFLFTFNPTLRRNEDYYRAHIYPLPEFQDINFRRHQWEQTREDMIDHWGWCEGLTMERHRDLVTFNVQSGCFGHHEDWAPLLLNLPVEEKCPDEPEIEVKDKKGEGAGEDKLEKKGEDKLEKTGKDQLEKTGEDKPEKTGEDQPEKTNGDKLEKKSKEAATSSGPSEARARGCLWKKLWSCHPLTPSCSIF